MSGVAEGKIKSAYSIIYGCKVILWMLRDHYFNQNAYSCDIQMTDRSLFTEP